MSDSPSPQRPKFGEFVPLDLWISDDFDDPVPEWEKAMAESEAELELDISQTSTQHNSI